MTDPVQIVYLTVVLSLGFWAALKVHRASRVAERRRKHELAHLADDDFAPITSTFHDDDAAGARARGNASIEGRFTVHRRLLVPVIVGTTLLLAALPLLSQVPATMISIVVAVLTVTLGVAARPILENAAAGLLMSHSRVARIGDTVKMDGWYGTIEDISVTHTTIRIWDGRRYVVPNNQMVQSKLINYSMHDQHLWAHVEFSVAWETDIEQLRQIAVDCAADSAFGVGDEEPVFWTIATEKEGILCWLAAWAHNPADAWNLSDDMRRRLAKAFQEHGITTHGFRQILSPGGRDEGTVEPRSSAD